VLAEEAGEPLEESIPVRVDTWLRRDEQDELIDSDCIFAFPLKSHAAGAFWWFW
jgi:hypothetical protein